VAAVQRQSHHIDMISVIVKIRAVVELERPGTPARHFFFCQSGSFAFHVFGVLIKCSKTLPTSHLTPLLITIRSLLSNALSSLQPTFVRRTSGSCLGTFTSVNVSLFRAVFWVILPCKINFDFSLSGGERRPKPRRKHPRKVGRQSFYTAV
jgi:hypothetical protein